MTALRRPLMGLALIAMLATGCVGSHPVGEPLTVANEDGEAATVSWQTPGLLGTMWFPDTGTDTVQACNSYRRGLVAGPNLITIRVRDQSLALALDSTSNDEPARYVLISPEGSISEVDEQSMPTTGCGTIN